MYRKQSGFYTLPSLLLGLLLIVYFLLAWIVNVIRLYLQAPLHETLFLSVLLGVGFSQPILIGVGLLGLYPDIRLTSDGIGYRFRILSFLKGEIHWQDISQIVQIKSRKRFQGSYVLLIENKNFLRWIKMPKLFFNFFYARLASFNQPILVLSPDLADRDVVIDLIKNNIQLCQNLKPLMPKD